MGGTRCTCDPCRKGRRPRSARAALGPALRGSVDQSLVTCRIPRQTTWRQPFGGGVPLGRGPVVFGGPIHSRIIARAALTSGSPLALRPAGSAHLPAPPSRPPREQSALLRCPGGPPRMQTLEPLCPAAFASASKALPLGYNLPQPPRGLRLRPRQPSGGEAARCPSPRLPAAWPPFGGQRVSSVGWPSHVWLFELGQGAYLCQLPFPHLKKMSRHGVLPVFPGRTAGRSKGVGSAWRQPSTHGPFRKPVGICWKGCFTLTSASLWDTVHCTRGAPE